MSSDSFLPGRSSAEDEGHVRVGKRKLFLHNVTDGASRISRGSIRPEETGHRPTAVAIRLP
jgi:hypothetical protein